MRYRHMYLSIARYELEQLPVHEEILQALLKRDVTKVEALAIANYEHVIDFVEQALASETKTAVDKGKQRRTAA